MYYENLPIYKAAMDLVVYIEIIVKGFEKKLKRILKMKKNIVKTFLLYGALSSLLASTLQAAYIRDNAKEIVLDTTTKMVWQDNNATTSSLYTWSAALTQCDTLSLGGFSDWRLPNKNELLLLVDKTKINPAIAAVFVNVNYSSYYWSSTTYAGGTSYAWYVDFYYGSDDFDVKTNSYYVRCVRGGQ